LSRKACAEYLGVSLRTVRHWDAGRNRVPWSAVRLLRLMRNGDLGALLPAWSGWVLNRNGLVSPDGKVYTEHNMRHWWWTCEQAFFWRQRHSLVASAGRRPEAPLISESMEAKVSGMPPPPSPNAVTSPAAAPTALAHAAGRAEGAAGAGMAVGVVSLEGRRRVGAAARSAAGLVISSTSGTRYAQTRLAQGFRRAHGS
jgi:hypothetical protein